MPDDSLSFIQRCALVILMTEAREVSNAHLVNARRFELKKRDRDGLTKAGLITVTQERRGGPLSLDLTEEGWRRAKEQLGAPLPEKIPHGSGYAAATLYAVLDTIARNFEHAGLSAEQFFVAPEPATEVAAETEGPGEIEARIRKAYAEVMPRTGEWVMLAKIRSGLGPTPRADVDAALVRLSQTPGVRLIPEANQKVLKPQERAAAVRIGNEDKHLIAFDS